MLSLCGHNVDKTSTLPHTINIYDNGLVKVHNSMANTFYFIENFTSYEAKLYQIQVKGKSS